MYIVDVDGEPRGEGYRSAWLAWVHALELRRFNYSPGTEVSICSSRTGLAFITWYRHSTERWQVVTLINDIDRSLREAEERYDAIRRGLAPPNGTPVCSCGGLAKRWRRGIPKCSVCYRATL